MALLSPRLAWLSLPLALLALGTLLTWLSLPLALLVLGTRLTLAALPLTLLSLRLARLVLGLWLALLSLPLVGVSLLCSILAKTAGILGMTTGCRSQRQDDPEHVVRCERTVHVDSPFRCDDKKRRPGPRPHMRAIRGDHSDSMPVYRTSTWSTGTVTFRPLTSRFLIR